MIALLSALVFAQDADRAAIDAKLAASQDLFDRCYTLATDDVPWASGHSMITFAVDKAGTVSGARVRNSCLHHEKADQCLVDRVGQIAFDPLTGDSELKIIHAFVFKPYSESPPEVAKVEKAIARCRAKAGNTGPAHVKVQYELAKGFSKPQSQRILHSTLVDVAESCVEKATMKMRFSGDFEGKMAHTFAMD